jgi:hypothetical protein
VAAEHILNEKVVLVEAAQWEEAEVDVPFTVIDLDKTNVLAAQLCRPVTPRL